MPINKLTIDSWNGRSVEDTTVRNPTWNDVKVTIDMLDADRHTLVFASENEGAELLIGGGKGQYVVSIAMTEDDLFTLLSSEEFEGTIQLKTGGQVCNYPATEVVGYDAVICAADFFYRNARPAPQLVWKRSGTDA